MTDKHIDLAPIKLQIAIIESEICILETKGTHSACIRARQHLLIVKKLGDSLRKEVLAYSKALKAKKANKKSEVVEPPTEPVIVNVDMPVTDDVTEPEAPRPIKVKRTRKTRKLPKGRSAPNK